MPRIDRGRTGPVHMRDLQTSPAHASVLESDGERSLAQLKMLHSLAARINKLNDVREIGEAITSELIDLIDYHNCRVFLLQPDQETLSPIAFRGELSEYQGETFEALTTSVGRGLTGHVAETGESYYAPNTDDDPYAVTIPGTPEVAESMLVVPMIYGERVIGVVVLSKLGVDQFDQEDLRVLEVLASHAAVAMVNARLLELERQAAKRARESEARTSAILLSALDCVVAMDHQGRIVEFNPAAERTFGYRREEVMGRDMAELIIPRGLRARHRNGLDRHLSTGSMAVIGKRVEMTALRADGTEFPVEVAVTKVDAPGPPLFTGYIRDITERRRAQAEIERALQAERDATQRLRTLDEMKNTFLQAVSHDMRTPLAAVLGLALTLDRTELDLSTDDKHDLTGRLATNARKLDRILSNLLDLERLSRGVVEPVRERTDVGSLARRVVAEADFLSPHRVTVEAPSVIAEIDPAKTERILENLLVNAVKHTPPETHIWVRVERQASDVLVVVEDAGPGVPTELRELIFEPFRQGHPEQHSPGSGIGLSVVARFAQLQGGRVWVEDRPGGGASFRVLLPDRKP